MVSIPETRQQKELRIAKRDIKADDPIPFVDNVAPKIAPSEKAQNLNNQIALQETANVATTFESKIAGGFGGDPLREQKDASPYLTRFIQPQEEPPSNMEVLKSAFALENTIGSVVSSLKNGEFIDHKLDPDFEIAPRIEGTKYEYFFDEFFEAGVSSDEEMERMKRKIDREELHRQNIANAGWKGNLYSMFAGTADIVNIIPVGGTAYKAFNTGKFIQGAVRTGAAAGLSTVASETILQSTQATRTIEESVINIGAATILGGILGGTAAKLSKTDFEKLAQRMQKQQQADESPILIDKDGNLSAAETPKTTLEQETLAGGKITKAVIKSTTKLNPTLRVLRAAAAEPRRVLQGLVRSNMYFKKNEQDIATDQSVEIELLNYRRGLAAATKANTDLYKKAIKNNPKMFKEDLNILGFKIKFNSQQVFNDKVSEAMIRGDVSDIPEVQQAAQTWRREVFDPLKEEAIRVGLLPEDVDVTTATSYLMRQYNVNKIVAQEKAFKKIISDAARMRLIPQIKKSLEGVEKRITAKELEKFKAERSDLDGKLKTAISKNNEEQIAKLTDRRIELDVLVGDEVAIEQYIEDITNSVFNNIRGIERKGVVMPYDVKIGARGPAKERVLTFVTDEELRPFLNTDVKKLAQDYTRTLGVDVELKKKFGDLNLKDQFDAIGKEYDELRFNAKTEKARRELSDEEEEVRKILNAYKDILRGDYGRPNDPDSFWPRASRISRIVQYMSKLGGVVIASIPDMSQHISVHGYGRVFKNLGNVITNLKTIKLSLEEYKNAGGLAEAVTHQMAALRSDLGDPYASNSRFERMINYMADNFSKFTFLDYWNDFMKGFASINTQDRLISTISNFNKAKAKDKRYLAFLGIDSKNINIIKDQLKKYGTKENGIFLANTAKWTDENAVRLYRNALNTDVERTIVTKGVGDVPLLMNTELGKTIGQFKSFAFAAHQQITIARLQQRDAAALSGTVTQIILGMMVYYLKVKGQGKEPSDDPAVWWIEGLDRSGMLPVIMEMNGIADATTARKISLQAVFGVEEPLSRFASRNAYGSLLGPSIGSVEDARSLLFSMFENGELTERDIRAIRRNLPYQNLFYLRGILDDLEKQLIE